MGEALVSELEEGSQLADFGSAGGVAGGMGPDAGDHQIFRGVLRGDELEHFGAVARPLKQESPEGIGHEFGLAFLENAMA